MREGGKDRGRDDEGGREGKIEGETMREVVRGVSGEYYVGRCTYT